MKVAIEKQTVDADGNVITEAVPCEDSEKVQKRLAKDHFVPPKPTAFAMFNHFRANVPYANIDGALHLYSSQDGYYRPVNQQGLEEFLLEQYYGMVEQSGSLRIVKTCAELIMKKKPAEVRSPEESMILCFQTGFLPIGSMENTYFQQYSEQVPMFPTYLINASGYSDMSDWSRAKLLQTPYMSAFLSSISNGNRVIEERIWQMIGYLLTPDVNGKCFFILQGVPNSGKSVLGNFIKALLSDHRIKVWTLISWARKMRPVCW